MKGSPYVGPRPYERGDQKNFYGREREARELQALLTAEREVLVYATSGAGKTSLFNARVIPALEEQGFFVLPVARVGMELPPQVQSDEMRNIFVLSTLLSLAGESADPRGLLDDDLPAYVQSLLAEAARVEVAAAAPAGLPADTALAELEEVHPPILIFDQFEELFTTHRERWEEAAGFFEQVRRLMDAVPGLGVVFSMREDHVAALDPFLPIFPNRLRARFRLEPLGQTGGLAAIARPAKNAGLPFAPGVAERLVDDLRRIKVQAAGKEEENALGPFVEPVQLQVVCSQLWASLPDDKTGEIQWEEVQQYGNVDRALTNFYETCVLRAAAMLGGIHIPPDVPVTPGMPGLLISPALERRVRTWVGSQLITPVGTRGLALRGPEETTGLPNEIVDVLEDLHMVRAEVRAGARWYELAHDRLVDPVLASNRAWEKSRETPLRTAARRWKETGDASLLYRGNALDEVKKMLRVQEERPITGFDFEPYELEFYEASLKAEQAAQRRRQRMIFTIIGALALLALMAALTVFAFRSRADAQAQKAAAQTLQVEAEAQRGLAVTAQSKAEEGQKQVEEQNKVIEAQKKDAEQQALRARGRELASYASSVLQQNAPQRAMLLALQGLRRYQDGGGERMTTGEQVLRDALRVVTGVPLRGQGTKLNQLAHSPDGRWLAGLGEQNIIYVWDLSRGLNALPKVFQYNQPGISDANITLAFSLDSRWLIFSEGVSNTVWDMQHPDAVPIFYTSQGFLNPRFLPGGRWLITGGLYEPLMFWDLQKGAPFEVGLEHTYDISDSWADPTGHWLLLQNGGSNPVPYALVLLNLQAPDPRATAIEFPKDVEYVWALNFSPDGRWLVMTLPNSGSGSRLRFFDLSTDEPLKNVVEVPFKKGEEVIGLSFEFNGEWLVTHTFNNDSDETVLQAWDLRQGVSTKIQPRSIFANKEGFAATYVSSQDGCWMALATDFRVRLLQMTPDGPQQILTFDMQPESYPGMHFSSPEKDGWARYFAVEDSENQLTFVDLNPKGETGLGCALRTADSTSELSVAPRVLHLGTMDAEIKEISFLPGGWLAALDRNGDARLWPLPVESASNSPEIVSAPVPGFGVSPLDFFSPEQSRNVVLAANDGIYLWAADKKGSQPEVVQFGPDDPVDTYAVSQDRNRLFTLMINGKGYFWDLSHPEQTKRSQGIDLYTNETPSRIERQYPFALSPDGRWLVYAPGEARQKLARLDVDVPWQDAQQRELYDVGPDRTITDITISQRWLVALVYERSVYGEKYEFYFWDVQNLSAAPLVFPAPEVQGSNPFIRFSPDGSFLVSEVVDHEKNAVPYVNNLMPLRLWNISEIKPGQKTLSSVVIDSPSTEIAWISFSPDGRFLLTTLNSGAILWDLERLRMLWKAGPSPELYSTTLLSEGSVGKFSFSPDGRWVSATKGIDLIYLWSLKELGQGPVMLRMPDGEQMTADPAFLPDGSAMFVVTADGALLRWPTDINELVPLTCALVNRELTAAEQQQYLQGETPLQVCPIR